MRRRASVKQTGIQLFPFLAVLICTMGALVVLLHAFARHGQAQAMKAAKAKAASQSAVEQFSVEEVEWRVGQLREARAKTEAQLADERLKLSHVEDHERRLREKLEQLKIAVAEMERAGAESTDKSRQSADELKAARAELDEAKKALVEVQRQGRHKSVNYSVVPYEGRSATNRRPIYIECRENLIVLQPEGIELTPSDFVGYFGPGNPLASALRAQREYFAQQAADGKLADEPYPLLLVRPEGTAAYYAARAALDSWGDDFGYELVGSDWEFKFPEPDPQLARLTRQVVAEARLRHREYILTSPQMAKRRSRPVYRAKAHGGFAPDGGSGGSLTGDGGGRDGWNDFAGDWAQGADTRPSRDPYGSPSEPGGSSGADETSQGPYADGSAATGTAGLRADGRSARPFGNSQSGPPPAGSDRYNDDASGGPGGEANWGHDQQHAGGGADSDQGKYSPGGNHSAGSSNANAAASAAPHEGAPPTATGDAADSDGSSGSQVAVGSPPSPHAPTRSKHKPSSMAATRGRDWGLPESGINAVAATRPILIDCYPDRLVIAPESRGHVAKEIRLAPRTQDSMDELVSAVWDHMKTWGKAGRGLYWRPTLSLEVKPAAADRYAQIKSLLADSGLDVHQRQSPATARPVIRQPVRQ